MKRLAVLLFMTLFLVGCQSYSSVDEYIEVVQQEISADGEVEVDVSYDENESAIIIQIMDERYSQNYQRYLDGDEAATEAIEQSIEQFGKGTENIDGLLPENDEGYEVWIRDYAGEDLLKYDNGELIYQKQ